jgi:hypothetical protein
MVVHTEQELLKIATYYYTELYLNVMRQCLLGPRKVCNCWKGLITLFRMFNINFWNVEARNVRVRREVSSI